MGKWATPLLNALLPQDFCHEIYHAPPGYFAHFSFGICLLSVHSSWAVELSTLNKQRTAGGETFHWDRESCTYHGLLHHHQRRSGKPVTLPSGPNNFHHTLDAKSMKDAVLFIIYTLGHTYIDPWPTVKFGSSYSLRNFSGLLSWNTFRQLNVTNQKRHITVLYSPCLW